MSPVITRFPFVGLESTSAHWTTKCNMKQRVNQQTFVCSWINIELFNALLVEISWEEGSQGCYLTFNPSLPPTPPPTPIPTPASSSVLAIQTLACEIFLTLTVWLVSRPLAHFSAASLSVSHQIIASTALIGSHRVQPCSTKTDHTIVRIVQTSTVNSFNVELDGS